MNLIRIPGANLMEKTCEKGCGDIAIQSRLEQDLINETIQITIKA